MSSPFDYYLAIDVEGTCLQDDFNYFNEIIELPAVLINAHTLQVESEFQRYIKPTVNPTLSPFCQEFTGISQATINKSETFETCLQEFESWLIATGCVKASTKTAQLRVAVITDGCWDIRKFISNEFSKLSRVSPLMLNLFSRWVDLRLVFSHYYYGSPSYPSRLGIDSMLGFFGRSFQGRQHSGIADARNIGAIIQMMLQDNCIFHLTNTTSFQLLGRKVEKSVWRSDTIFKNAAIEIKTINKVLNYERRYNPTALHNKHQVYRFTGPLESIKAAVQGSSACSNDINFIGSTDKIHFSIRTLGTTFLSINNNIPGLVKLPWNHEHQEGPSDGQDEATFAVGSNLFFKKLTFEGSLLHFRTAVSILHEKQPSTTIVTVALPPGSTLELNPGFFPDETMIIEDVTSRAQQQFSSGNSSDEDDAQSPPQSHAEFLYRLRGKAKYLLHSHPNLAFPTGVDESSQNSWTAWRTMMFVRRAELQKVKAARKKQILVAIEEHQRHISANLPNEHSPVTGRRQRNASWNQQQSHQHPRSPQQRHHHAPKRATVTVR